MVARGFILMAVIYGLVGIALGLEMAITKDHDQIPTHAHVNLMGWVSFMIFGLFYRIVGDAVSVRLAQLHFWLAQISALGIFLGIWLIYAGQPQFDPLAAISSLAYGASFILFAVIVVLWLRSGAKLSGIRRD